MLRVLIVLGIFSICSARPSEKPEIALPNCPEGQAWVNGDCNNRNNSLVAAVPLPSDIEGRNMITVPPNCPPGQQWINGQCRDVWRRRGVPSDVDVNNVITVPPNCPPGQQWINGQCRDVWRGGALADSELFQKLVQNLWAKSALARNTGQEEVINSYDTLPKFEIEDDPRRNIISVPNQCPEGYKPDALGICRPKL